MMLVIVVVEVEIVQNQGNQGVAYHEKKHMLEAKHYQLKHIDGDG